MKNNKHTHGFKAPDDYFISFERKLLEELALQEKVKQTGFGVPSTYFESIEDRMVAAVHVAEKETPVRSLFHNRTFWLVTATAACFAIVFSVVDFNSTTNFSGIDAAMVEAYINDDNLDLNTYDVLAVLDDDAIAVFSNQSELFSEENLENYLLDNLEDTSLINE
jgi:hypothetical protein